MIKTIDINADVGEGVGNEDQLLPYLSSCNIACGGHAGDVATIRSVIRLALKHNVKIGAHPSYPDREGFGRRASTPSCLATRRTRKRIKASLIEQIHQVCQIASEEGATVQHIKPHGALYNEAAKDPTAASLIVEVMGEINENLTLYTPYHSVIAQMAQDSTPIALEGFADRAYHSDYCLVSRTVEGAVLKDAEAVTLHVEQLLNGTLKSFEGDLLPFKLDTLCVHGDTPKALSLLKAIHLLLAKHKITVR